MHYKGIIFLLLLSSTVLAQPAAVKEATPDYNQLFKPLKWRSI